MRAAGAQAPTYVPRLVVVDASGALGGVSPLGGDDAFAGGGDEPPVVATWGGATHLVRREPVPKSDFVRALEAEAAEAGDAEAAAGGDSDDETRPRRTPAAAAAEAAASGSPDDGEGGGALERAGAALEGRVAYWSDYAKALLHPRSTLLLPGVWHGVHAFAGYGESREFAAGETGEDARDRIRRAPPLMLRRAAAHGACARRATGFSRRSVTRWAAFSFSPTTAAASARSRRACSRTCATTTRARPWYVRRACVRLPQASLSAAGASLLPTDAVLHAPAAAR